jgi:K(+)-stimulated pyrophosphate-energized sodium pump
MVLASLGSFYFNMAVANRALRRQKNFNWEAPLTDLVWITSIISIIVCFVASKLLLGELQNRRGASRISGGCCPPSSRAARWRARSSWSSQKFSSAPARATSAKSPIASEHGGASLNILSGLVAGNFSAFWMGLVILSLMFTWHICFRKIPTLLALMPAKFTFAAPIFAFGLVAFGFLAMAPVTIAVDSFGPVTDNAQSVYELSRIESQPDISAEIEKDFGFKPNFADAKLELEKGDGAGNTFKATAKPVLIGTAVVGATTMIFGIIMLLENVFGDAIAHLSLVQPQIIFGLLMGGAVIYWFTGASIQAVVTGAYRAVVFIKENLKFDQHTASLADSKKVVEICTVYAQRA